jgi:Carboxypeptidase regulatory-like domain
MRPSGLPVDILRGGYSVRFKKIFPILLFIMTASGVVYPQDKTTGSIKGKVRVEVGAPSGVTVVIREGEKPITQVATDKNGEFLVTRLTPGKYGLTFRKPGLSIGTIENVEVQAGKTRSLGDRLILKIDEGSIAFIRGSVFNSDGRSVPNAKVELGKILEDGTVKKIDGRLTTETGTFVFRLAPELAKYRVSVKQDGGEAVSKEVEVDGAAVYRVALSLPPKQ